MGDLLLIIENGFIIDKISLILLGLCIWIWLVINIAEFFISKIKNLFFLILIFRVGMVFIVRNYLTFYIIFEVTLIPILVYIVLGGGRFDRIEAGIYILLYTLIVSFPLLINIFININLMGRGFIFLISGINLSLSTYIFIILSFIVKLPIYIFHLWLPKAHVEASVGGSILLAGVILKIGGYGILRFLNIFKDLFILYSYIYICLSLFGRLLARLERLRFIDIKILVAYSSVVHIGVIISGVLLIRSLGIIGGLLMMVSHGICSRGLFGVLNLLYERRGRRRIFFRKGGLLLNSSLLFFWFILCVNNISSPPSINLFSELFIFRGFIYLFFNLLIFFLLIIFWGSVYRIYLFSFSQYGKFVFNLIFKERFCLREFLLIYFHIFPLNILFLILDFYI